MQAKNPDEALKFILSEGAKAGTPQTRIAEAAGISKQTLSIFLKRGTVKYSTLQEIAKANGYEISLTIKKQEN